MTISTPETSDARTARAIAEFRKSKSEAKPESIQQKYRHDPLGFVLQEWPWGIPGTVLEHMQQPDDNQVGFLNDLGAHVRRNNFDGHTPVAPLFMSISSGVGTGKSTLAAFLTWWILRTRPFSKGKVTAGTFQQLEEGTWAEIMHWGNMARGRDDFEIQKSGIFHKKHAETWKVNPITADARRSQSFAGQHARTATSFYIFDEGSAVPHENWAPAYGCLSDGEPMMFAFGQCLSTTGEFYDVTFGGKCSKWDTRTWSGWNSAFTNKQTLKEWEEEYGEDSDFYRVRVLGLPPRASELQFIGQGIVDEARKRTHKALPDEPLIAGFDAGNGGLARFAIAFRRGLDGASIPPILMPGDTPRDVVVAKLCEILSDRSPTKRVTALFGDQAFGAVIIQRVRDSGFTNAFEVNFGEPSPNKHYLNMRAYMWGEMKQWMTLGSIPDDEKLCQGFMAPGFHHRNGKLVLESKQDMAKRGIRSPDGPDSYCLTFSRKVAPPPRPVRITPQLRGGMGWAR